MHLQILPAHTLPRQTRVFNVERGEGGEGVISSPCAVVREVHEGSATFVFVLLAEISACRRSQFLGAPREWISTDGGF